MKLRILTIAMFIVLASCGDKEIEKLTGKVIKLGHTGSVTSPYQLASEMFAEKIEEATDGRYTIEIYPSDLLGTQNQSVEGAQVGTVDMILTSDSVLETVDPKFGVLTLPFLFDNVDQVFDVVNGEVGKILEESLAEKNLIIIGWWENGIRQIFNTKRPINSLADLKGLKIRTPGSPVMVETFNALGALAVPMGFGEVFSALQLNTIDGAEGPTTHLIQQRYYELTKHVAIVNHNHIVEPLLMSKALWNKLSPEDQKIFKTIGKEVGVFAFEHYKTLQSTEIAEAEANDVVFTYPDTEPFKKAIVPVYTKFGAMNADLLKMIQDSIAQSKK